MSYILLYLTKFLECISLYRNTYQIESRIMHCKAQDSALLCCGWLKQLTFSSRCFCLNELFLVLQEICVQRTLMNSILLILCFFFCTALVFILMSLLQIHYIFFLPSMVYKTRMPLTVFHCHTILIENETVICRLLCKSILSTMFIKTCVKSTHNDLASYVEVGKLNSKINAAL